MGFALLIWVDSYSILAPIIRLSLMFGFAPWLGHLTLLYLRVLILVSYSAFGRSSEDWRSWPASSYHTLAQSMFYLLATIDQAWRISSMGTSFIACVCYTVHIVFWHSPGFPRATLLQRAHVHQKHSAGFAKVISDMVERFPLDYDRMLLRCERCILRLSDLSSFSPSRKHHGYQLRLASSLLAGCD